MVYRPRREMTGLLFAVLIFAGLQENSWSQDGRVKTFSELARYTGSDRERLLYQGAQKEGKLVWYTTLTMHKELARVFESKFKGVTIEPYRASGATMATRLIQETQAKRHLADAVESPFPTLMLLRQNKVLMPFSSPHLATYPESARDTSHRQYES